MDQEAQDNQAREVFTSLVNIVELTASIRKRQAAMLGIKLSAFQMLEIARASGDDGVLISQAADQLGIKPQALSASVAAMAKKGLITRKTDSDDGRARRIHITDDGRMLLDKASFPVDELCKNLQEQIPQLSVAKLVLGRLENALKQST